METFRIEREQIELHRERDFVFDLYVEKLGEKKLVLHKGCPNVAPGQIVDALKPYLSERC